MFTREPSVSSYPARLPGASTTPIWLWHFAVQVALLGGVMALVLTIDNLSWHYLLAALGGAALITTVAMHLVIGRRISRLCAMLVQDPQVIVGDPACLLRLSRIPWYGVKEVDRMQLAVLQTYHAYAMDARHAGKSGGVSHAGDLDNTEWLSAASGEEWGDAESDDTVSPGGGGGGDTLRAYLLGGNRRTSSHGGVAITRSSAGGEQQQTPGVFRKWLTPRSTASRASDGFYSIPSASAQSEGTPLMQGTRTMDEHQVAEGQRSRGVSMTSYPAGGAPVGGVRVGIGGDHLSMGPPLFDPLNENSAGWAVLHKGLKEPGSSLLVQLLSQVKVGQSLSTVTLPVHILESRSLLEKLSDIYIYWHLLLPVANGEVKNPYEKLILIFKWFIAAYHMKPEGAKKPYNPILGEAFFAGFVNNGDPSDQHQLLYVAEQVSHHPPVTAMYAQYKELIEVHSVYHPRSKLVSLNCAASIGEGSSILHFPQTGERYRITWPSAYVSGIVAGTPRLELGGSVTITDMGMNATAKIEFLRKGWISGSFDQMTCKIFTPESAASGHEFYGTWFEKIMKKDQNDASAPSNVFHNPHTMPHSPRPQARDLNGHQKQSRAIWRDLTVSLRASDAVAAAAAKHEVETVQRQERKVLAAEGRQHETTFFKFRGGKSIKEARDHDRNDVAKWEFVGHELITSGSSNSSFSNKPHSATEQE